METRRRNGKKRRGEGNEVEGGEEELKRIIVIQ